MIENSIKNYLLTHYQFIIRVLIHYSLLYYDTLYLAILYNTVHTIGVKDVTASGPFSPNYTMEVIETYRLVVIDR